MDGGHDRVPVAAVLGEADAVENRADLPLGWHNHALKPLVGSRHHAVTVVGVLCRCARRDARKANCRPVLQKRARA